MIVLRPHHILCIQQFKGYGYNEKFVNNMFDIINKLEKEKIIIKVDFDEICKSCPNLVDSICISDNKIHLLDKKVINYLKIPLNQLVYFNSLKLNINKILTEEIFYKICNDCSWYKKGFCNYNKFKK